MSTAKSVPTGILVVYKHAQTVHLYQLRDLIAMVLEIGSMPAEKVRQGEVSGCHPQGN